MTKLGPKGMKMMKVIHLILIMMWTVGVMGMTVVMSGSVPSTQQLAVSLENALKLDTSLVIPGALLCVMFGIVYGFFTNWGFFKYRWLTVKWIVSILIILVGSYVFHPACVEALQLATTDVSGNESRISDLISRCQIVNWIQIISQIMLVAISVFKPWKTTRKK